jgi:hypothetical protein
MKPVLVNRKALITEGILKGKEGLVVGFDSIEDRVIIKLDEITLVGISSDYIKQED